MKIKKYLLKHRLITDENKYIDYSDQNNERFSVSDFSGLTISSSEITGNSDTIVSKVKNIWDHTNLLFAVSTTETKSKGLDKIIENTISIASTPAAPGLFYFFKDKNLQEFFHFNLQDSNSSNIKEDLLVYLALTKLKNEKVFDSMPQMLKDKVTRHLGNNIRAMAESRKLLNDLTNRQKILELCTISKIGIQDSEAMWIHTSLIKTLPPSLRVYIGCSSLFYGDPESADIIKIHKKSFKVTYYIYDDFENKLLPEMHDRIKIDLSRQKMDHFDHRTEKNPEVVYFKERFISENNENFEKWNKFSKYLENNGYSPEKIHIEQNKNLTDILKRFCA